MKLVTQLVTVVAVTGWATAGMAFFDGEVFYGSQTASVKYTTAGTEKSKDIKGTEMGATFLLSPVPLIPVGIGITASQGTIDLKDVAQLQADDIVSSGDLAGFTATGKGTSKSTFYGPVIKVWAPIPFIKPYLKASYLMGAEIVDEDFTLASPSGSSVTMDFDIKTKTTYTHTATEFALGLGYSPIKLTSIFAEYSIHKGKRKAKSLSGEMSASVDGASAGTTAFTTADLSDDDKKQKTADLKSIRLGVSVGI